MMARPVALFHLGAGPQAGLGHLRRCLGLAVAMQGVSATCVFLVNPDRTVRGPLR